MEVTAALATIPSREDTLARTIASLLPQVDRLFVYLNGQQSDLPCLQDPKIETASSDRYGDRGDAGKFFWADKVSGLHLTCDDDIIYPPDYVEAFQKRSMIIAGNSPRLQNPGTLGLYGVLGARYVAPIRSYYRCRFPRYGVRYGLSHDVPVHMIGTGTLAFWPREVNFPDPDTVFLAPNMADVWLSVWARQNNVPMICVARPSEWLEPMPVKGPAIYDDFRKSRDDSVQTAAIAMYSWPELPRPTDLTVTPPPPVARTAPSRRP